MVDQKTLEALAPLAYQWVKKQEEFVLAHGIPLNPQQLADARLAGVRNCERIRVLIVDRIPFPDTDVLIEATRRSRIITDDTRCAGFGYAIFIRADAWGDREVILHNLVHIAQCERSGGLEQWIPKYLTDRINCPDFTLGALEEEARRVAREICIAGSKT